MASSPASWVVLDRNVEDADLVDIRDREWATVKCSRKEAYGCGEFGQALVEGLTLYMRLSDGRNDRFSALCFWLRRCEALQRIAAATIPRHSLFPGHPRTTARITFSCHLDATEENLVILTTAFNHGRDVYYLLYDNIDESLNMIPCFMPFHMQPVLGPLAGAMT
ncbi:hypothetical protein E2562_039456 [Oryza meyeriana var. granulata]|uniref:DUF1618 domain-containing protein n=1 Tax=Oryza meyeriana var. granulata TaxID=110450 RepID=A0A6G1E9Y6_9ORYZ|nr:hypothetical protein E2562_039456 [Oryza meyeriana var. granulata]